MKPYQILGLCWLAITSLHAQEDDVRANVIPALVEPTAKAEGWGTSVNPELDCQFSIKEGVLAISVPPTPISRDLAPEIKVVNAPRVLQAIEGDFSYTVKVTGDFKLTGESTQEGRTSYKGGAVILMGDTDHVVTLARAVLQRPGSDPYAYANFGIRSGGAMLEGTGATAPLPLDGPVFLRLERKDHVVQGSVSIDGETWKELPAATLPATWPEKTYTGVAAITTSATGFEPQFTKPKIAEAATE